MKSIQFEYLVDGVILTSVSIFGLVGTLLSIRVLLRPHLRNSFSNLLVGLAVCDVSFLTCAVLIIGLPKAWTWYQINVSVYVIPVVYGMIGVTRTGSVYLTMSVTLERYFAIVKPLSRFQLKRWLIPISVSFAGLYNIPRFFELERYVFRYTNETLVRATSLREDPFYVSIYSTWMKLVFLEAIPYVTIIVLNALIVSQIVSSGKFRERFRTSAGTQQIRPAKTSEESSAATRSPNVILRNRHLEVRAVLSCGSNRRAILHQHKMHVKAISSSDEGLDKIGQPRSLKSIAALRRNKIEKDTSSCPNLPLLSLRQPKLDQIESSHERLLPQEPENGCPKDVQLLVAAAVHQHKKKAGLKKGSEARTNAAAAAVPVSSSSTTGSPTEFRNRVQAQFRRVRNYNGLTRQQQQELSLGLTLVTISVLFIVCQSVKIVPDLYELLCSANGMTSQSQSGHVTCHSTYIIDTLISLGNLFACVNSAANFLIYMLRGKKFREAFLSTYSCRRHRSSLMNFSTNGMHHSQLQLDHTISGTTTIHLKSRLVTRRPSPNFPGSNR